jgi:HTH-type transcriptional regulator/antitoxin HipB
MNIEIANRLVKLRKEKNLSQEALANELGISRQAVSKWERAESSPDTDNLIMLAKLYGVSLDELLNTDQEVFESGEALEEEDNEKSKDDEEYVHISFKEGIHVKDKNGDEVHVGWKGIHVKGSKGEDNEEVNIDGNGVYVNGRPYDEYKRDFPLVALATIVYIYLGIQYHAWHPGWLIFGFIPLIHTFISAIKYRDIMIFAYPVAVFMYIGYFGFVNGEWYPHWIIGLVSIPIYYSLMGYMKHAFKSRKHEEE